MTKVKNYIGIDVSKLTFNVSYDANGKVRSKRFAYNEEGMQAFLKLLPPDGHCVLESTGTYHCRLAYFLYAHEVSLSVMNPLSVKRYAQVLMLRTKTDKADSLLLRSFGMHMQPAGWKPKADMYVEMRQLIGLLEQFGKQRAALKNQQEAFSHSVVQNKYVAARLKSALEQVERDMEEVEGEMRAFVREVEGKTYERLQSIPGIGPKTAVVLIALTEGMKSFDSAKQLSSYFGLCPRITDSGTSVRGKARICKMGMGMIRRLLYLCAWSAKRCNGACRELYERLLRQGKPKKLALIAVANKLIKQAFAMVTNRRDYVEDFAMKKV